MGEPQGEHSLPQNGFLAGVFDLFHVGHLDVLERARQACDRLVVGVLTDEWAMDAWGARPFVPLVERVQILQHLRAVDEVVVIDDVDNRLLTGRLVFAADLDGVLGADDLNGVLGLRELPDARMSRSTILRAAIDQRQSRSSVA